MTASELRERWPSGGDWQQVATTPELRAQALSISVWVSGPVCAISALERADYPDGSGEAGPQWHISITRKRKRPKPTDVRRALRAFRMVGTEIDNHHPGNAQHFWMPVDPTRRVDCECKTDEVLVVDPDGYTWTNPHDPAECRGCEATRLLGKPCPIHAKQESKP